MSTHTHNALCILAQQRQNSPHKRSLLALPSIIQIPARYFLTSRRIAKPKSPSKKVTFVSMNLTQLGLVVIRLNPRLRWSETTRNESIRQLDIRPSRVAWWLKERGQKHPDRSGSACFLSMSWHRWITGTQGSLVYGKEICRTSGPSDSW